MELYKELLVRILERQKMEVTFPKIQIDPKEIVNLQSYRTLELIKEVIEDKTLEDNECYERIEKIICIFEENFGSLSYRHDFS